MRRILPIAVLGIVALVAIAAAGPLMSQVEAPRYDVLRSDGPIELRRYPSLVVASVTVQGQRRAAISDGFKRLAGYIFGGNAGEKKVAMTAPVMQNETADAPPAVDPEHATWTVRFVMPRVWSLDTLPRPKDDRVALTTAPGATYAVIRFSGFTSDATLAAKTTDLNAFIARNKLEERGRPIFAFFNPPWTLPFLRRNEVMIEVRADGT